ncbi:probable polygalacturonase At3g15720 [Cynara cardunculus var. scolymus]|uniref:probable polygalacturonase At3g15720 n=1 Tax=Cynara cardunculus var. scolymus TaxID=59895 RepID=UPI000D6285B3|nr:probable polygalacturonase At3g15720 [Cynara cardunculus var. scolymus]
MSANNIITLLDTSTCWGAAYDIMQYGAKGDGITDDTKAFEQAWQMLCNDVEPGSSLTIPSVNTFLVGPISFQGPCKSPDIHFEILGTIIAPEDPNSWNGCETGAWIFFANVTGLTVDGGGMINGRGAAWWIKSPTYMKEELKCSIPPTALHFENCNSLQLRHLSHRDSPRNHIGLSRSSYSTISDLDIAAPANSPNTDGIDISTSTQIQIKNLVIKTGDDCIALNNGATQINITDVNCGPGHGISIGSLGLNNSYDTVEGIYIKRCNFTGTQNGARIKTWQGGSGYARDITFENIGLDNVFNPIIIDQHYCPDRNNCPTESAAVNVSNISYKFFQGTSSSRIAINFNCSDKIPCSGISLDRINIVSSTNRDKTAAYCNNAYGTISSTKPSVTCLSH